MENDLSNYRRNYQKIELSMKDISENPMELFQKWFFEVEKFGGDSVTETRRNFTSYMQNLNFS